MSKLSKIKNKGKKVVSEDKVPVSGFNAMPTGVYLMSIDNAFVNVTANGVLYLGLDLSCKEGNVKFLQLYVANSNGETTTTFNGETTTKPGYLIASDISTFINGKSFEKQDTKEKSIKVYGKNAEVDYLHKWIGKKLHFAIQHVTENKNVKNKKGDYVPSSEKVTKNIVKKVFNVKKQTAEELSKKKKASFIKDFKENFSDADFYTEVKSKKKKK